jgi:hypothetical protein
MLDREVLRHKVNIISVWLRRLLILEVKISRSPNLTSLDARAMLLRLIMLYLDRLLI